MVENEKKSKFFLIVYPLLGSGPGPGKFKFLDPDPDPIKKNFQIFFVFNHLFIYNFTLINKIEKQYICS